MNSIEIREIGREEHWYTGELYCLPKKECQKFIEKGGHESCSTWHNVLWVQVREYYRI